jgi:signal transduction histidine kinase
MEQVLSNLIGNALEQGADPIAVRVADGGDDVTLSVHNRGAPIPAHVLPRIFEPYRRRLNDAGKGLGLGLYIVSQIVRAHHATISVRSFEGEGTTFTIRWPRRPPLESRDTESREHDRQAYRAGLLQQAVQSGVDGDED